MLANKNNTSRKRNCHSARNPFRFLVWAVLGVLFIPVSAYTLLHLPWVQEQIIGKVAQRVENVADVRVELKSYRWSPFSNIRLTSLQMKSGKKDFLRCEEAQLSYKLSWEWPYLIPKVLFLDKPLLRLEKDVHGKWRIPRTGNVNFGDRVLSDLPTRFRSFPWPEVRINSGKIVAFQEGQVVLSLQNVTGSLPVRVLPGDDGPTLTIDLEHWQGKTDMRGWFDFSGIGATK